jgi:biotin carboxyl carrier protein
MKSLTVILQGNEHAVIHHGGNEWSVGSFRGEVEIRETEAGVYTVVMAGRAHRVVAGRNGNGWLVLTEGVQRSVSVESARERLMKQYTRSAAQEHRHLEIRAPMPALVGRILVAPGDEVEAGRPLLVLEAMKMENEIKVHLTGRVKEILVERGRTVEKGQILLTLE